MDILEKKHASTIFAHREIILDGKKHNFQWNGDDPDDPNLPKIAPRFAPENAGDYAGLLRLQYLHNYT